WTGRRTEHRTRTCGATGTSTPPPVRAISTSRSRPMKRRTLLSAAAASATAAGLAACGSGTPGQSKEDPAAAGRSQVEFWGNVFTTPENAWYEKIVEDFNAAQDE